MERSQIGIVFPLQAVPQRPGRPGRADFVFSHGISGPMDGVGTFLSRGQVDAWVIGGTSRNSVRQEPSPACCRTRARHSGRRVRETVRWAWAVQQRAGLSHLSRPSSFKTALYLRQLRPRPPPVATCRRACRSAPQWLAALRVGVVRAHVQALSEKSVGCSCTNYNST